MSKKPITALFMRVSTARQKHDRQRTILSDWTKSQGLKPDAHQWYRETASATARNRTGLAKLLRDVEAGKIHTVVFERLDRLSRSTRTGLEILQQLADSGCRVVAVQQGIDFNGSMGKLLATIFLALAEWERDLIGERITEGMRTAKENGKHVGRPRNSKRYEQVRKLRFDDHLSVSEIADKLGTTRQNVYYLLKAGQAKGDSE